MSPEERERHRRALDTIRDCLCRGAPRRLCPVRFWDDFFACTRPAGHENEHVACAGIDGPHAVAAWLNEAEIRSGVKPLADELPDGDGGSSS